MSKTRMARRLCIGLLKMDSRKGGAKPDVNDKGGKTPLYWAAANGFKQVCVVLIDSGAHPDVKDKWGKTPLHRAAEKGFEEVCLALIKGGAQLDVKDKHGETPLMLAAKKGEINVCLTLIENGADIGDEEISLLNKLGNEKLQLALEKRQKNSPSTGLFTIFDTRNKNSDKGSEAVKDEDPSVRRENTRPKT